MPRADAVAVEHKPEEAVVSSKAQAHYNRWGNAYGRSRLLPSLQKMALTELRPRAGDRVLDAAWAGALVLDVAPRVERAVGVHLSDGMLQLARSRLLAAPEVHRLAKVEFLLGPSDAGALAVSSLPPPVRLKGD